MAHGEDLRQEGVAEEVVRALQVDWTTAPLDSADRVVCAYVDKLTRDPGTMRPGDIESLREAGFDDPAIHDICAVTAYFAYVNRIADGLGVDLERDMQPQPPWEEGIS